ncbi:unnamed protein product [Phytophthora lilii]|uniref:Unnamed protein product n=1 Tax=Phytophthora lilii TaxID=2077276 RepID=A0A9W6YLG8_9STRA|nr:unnamed protein product [Phytophthora lilii]
MIPVKPVYLFSDGYRRRLINIKAPDVCDYDYAHDDYCPDMYDHNDYDGKAYCTCTKIMATRSKVAATATEKTYDYPD